MRAMLLLVAGLMLAGCAGVDPAGGAEDWCRDSSRCSPKCGSVATGAAPECDPYQREGRTRG